MVTKFKPSLLLNPDESGDFTYNPVMGHFVDSKRPTADSADYIDVIYDEGLAGNFKQKLKQRVTNLLQGGSKTVDLFFTDQLEYNTFIAMFYKRGSAITPQRTPAGVAIGMVESTTETVGDVTIDTKSVTLLHAAPFVHVDGKINYYGLRLSLRSIHAQSKAHIFFPVSTFLSLKLSDVVEQNFTDGVVPNKEDITDLKAELISSERCLVFSDEATFMLFYRGLTGATVEPKHSRSVVREFVPMDSSVDTFVIDRFTSFGNLYYVVNGENIKQLQDAQSDNQS